MKFLTAIAIIGALIFYFHSGYSPGGASARLSPAIADIRKVSTSPVQKDLPGTSKIPFKQGNLSLVAEYEVTARILSREDYRIGKESEFAPVDLALGWGRMSSTAVTDRLNITQGGRFYNYRYKNPPPIPQSEIAQSSANTHIIPANASVLAAVNKLKKGQIVTLKGFLVNYRETYPNGGWWAWNTSTTRSDTGAGACELFYVESVVAY